jgi:coenzyme F420-reducing hydrogenase delta subunit
MKQIQNGTGMWEYRERINMMTVMCSKKINLEWYFTNLYNRFDQCSARQQLYKHGPTQNNRRACVFYVVHAMTSAGNRPMNSLSDM